MFNDSYNKNENTAQRMSLFISLDMYLVSLRCIRRYEVNCENKKCSETKISVNITVFILIMAMMTSANAF